MIILVRLSLLHLAGKFGNPFFIHPVPSMWGNINKTKTMKTRSFLDSIVEDLYFRTLYQAKGTQIFFSLHQKLFVFSTYFFRGRNYERHLYWHDTDYFTPGFMREIKTIISFFLIIQLLSFPFLTHHCLNCFMQQKYPTDDAHIILVSTFELDLCWSCTGTNVLSLHERTT